MKLLIINLCIFFFLLFFISPVFAQKATLRSGNYEVYLGDELNIPLRIEDISVVPKIEFPNVKNIKFSAGDRASSFSYTKFINGKITRSRGIEITIIIRPEALGAYRIPGIFFYDKKNKKKKTTSFTVRVLKPKISNSMFTEIIPSKKKYYQGEKIILTLNWFLKEQVQNFKLFFSLLEKKDFYNLKNLPLTNNKQKRYFRFSPLDNIPFLSTNTKKNGETYTLYSSKFSFFIDQPGIWDEAIFSAKGDIRISSNKKNIFGRKVRRYEKIFVDNPLLEIEILPLPPEPEHFSKAVGIFQITKKVDTQKLKVGEPIDFRLKIKGIGNFHAINPPQTTGWEEFEVYYRAEKTKINDKFIEFSYTLRPKNEKINNIPPISFVYFDLAKKKYITHTTFKVPIQVDIAEKVSLSNVISFAPLEEKQEIKPEIVITPQFSNIEYTPDNIVFGTITFFLFPPISFFIIRFWNIKRRKKHLWQQKQAILAKYKLPKNADFSKTILLWVYQFLLQKEIAEEKILTIFFHKSNLHNLENCNEKEIAFLEKIRNLYNEMTFCKKKINQYQQETLQNEMNIIHNV